MGDRIRFSLDAGWRKVMMRVRRVVGPWLEPAPVPASVAKYGIPHTWGPAPSTSTDGVEVGGGSATEPGSSVLLWVDPAFMSFPLEILGGLDRAVAVTRDWSFAVTGHRLRTVVLDGGTAGATPPPAASAGKGGKGTAAAATTTPVENGSTGPVTHASFPTVSLAQLTYLADLGCEDDVECPPGRSVAALTETVAQLRPRMGGLDKEWKGVVGESARVTGEDECWQMINDAKALLYVAPGRVATTLSPPALAGADLRSCRMAVIADGSTHRSLDRTQSVWMGKQTAWVQRRSRPEAMAALMSLRGVGVVVTQMGATHPDVSVAVAGVVAKMKEETGDATVARAVRELVEETVKGGVLPEYLLGNTVVFGIPHLVAG
jgi:hypothetical protein